MSEAIEDSLRVPSVRSHGEVEEAWIDRLLDAAEKTPREETFVVEVMTVGGDADAGRRLSLEICLLRAQGRSLAFLGKTCVYSAGAVFMGCFTRDERWLTEDCWLLIHERQLTKDIPLNGPLRACKDQLNKAVSEVDTGMVLERDGFKAIAEGSALSAEEVERRSRTNWYLSAQEAVDLRLVAGLYTG